MFAGSSSSRGLSAAKLGRCHSSDLNLLDQAEKFGMQRRQFIRVSIRLWKFEQNPVMGPPTRAMLATPPWSVVRLVPAIGGYVLTLIERSAPWPTRTAWKSREGRHNTKSNRQAT
jgi:hypothetical protein